MFLELIPDLVRYSLLNLKFNLCFDPGDGEEMTRIDQAHSNEIGKKVADDGSEACGKKYMGKGRVKSGRPMYFSPF